MKKQTKKKSKPSLISRVSLAFAKRKRATFLMLIITMLLGAASYYTLLVREGFPTINVPVVVISTPYFVDDSEVVNQDVTTPIEESLNEVEEIKQVRSYTNGNFSRIMAEFPEEVTSKEALAIVEDKVQGKLAEGISPQIFTIDASAINGEHNLLVTITAGETDYQQLQEKAEIAREEYESIPGVISAEVINVVEDQVNPVTGETIQYQGSFNRLAKNRDDAFEFKKAIHIGIKTKDGAGLVAISDRVHELEETLLKDEDLKDVNFSYLGDPTVLVREQISTLESNIISALIAVILVLFFFVNWRASIVTALFIPTVLGGTFLALYLVGYTLNVLTLFALLLVLGLFVDDAIVVVEAIDYQKKLGKKGLEALKEAINNIGMADISGTLTTVLVFVPLVFVSGILGSFIRIIPITVIISLLISVVIALTITPFLSNYIISDGKRNKEKTNFLNFFSRGVEWLGEKLSNFIKWYLGHWAPSLVVFIVGIALIAGGFLASTQLKFAIFPPPKDAEEILVRTTFPEGTDLETAEEISIEIEETMTDKFGKEIDSYAYYIATKNGTLNTIQLTNMDEREKTAEKIVDDLAEIFADYEKAEVVPVINSAGPPTDDYPFQVEIFGDDAKALEKTATEVEDFVTGLKLSGGESIVEAKVDFTQTLAKKNGQRYILVSGKTSDLENTALIVQAQEKVAKEFDAKRLENLGLEENAISFDSGQETENLQSFESTLLALAVAFALMYILLVLLYESYTQPLLIFLAVPLSFPGLFPGLIFTNNPLGFFTMIGIIALAGIVVNNTIMLVDYANQARKDGMNPTNAIANAVKARFRPIMTTSTTTIVALLPLALTDPFWESLSYSIIFGLFSSSILVVTIFPVWYAWLEGIRNWRDGLVR